MNETGHKVKERVLERTIEAVRIRSARRVRRRKQLMASSLLALVALAGMGLGLQVGRGGGRQAGRAGPDLPPPMASVASTARFVPADDGIPAGWGGANSLVLVVNEDGMEMRVMNDSQVAALARKPGCEFALTPDAVMWVSEYGSEADRFSPGVEF